VEVPEDAERLRDRLRLSNDHADRLVRAAQRGPDIGPGAPEAAARLYLYRHGAPAYRQRVLLGLARSGTPVPGAGPVREAWRHRLDLPQRWPVPRFPLKGADVLALGVPAGPRVGELLRILEDRWIAGDFSADATALRAQLHSLCTD
jgi:poly(A) polymerase